MTDSQGAVGEAFWTFVVEAMATTSFWFIMPPSLNLTAPPGANRTDASAFAAALMGQPQPQQAGGGGDASGGDAGNSTDDAAGTMTMSPRAFLALTLPRYGVDMRAVRTANITSVQVCRGCCCTFSLWVEWDG